MPYYKKMRYNMTNIDYASPIPTPTYRFGLQDPNDDLFFKKT